MKKCSKCGKYYDKEDKCCPFCGNVEESNLPYSKLGLYLNDNMHVGNFKLTRLNIILILCINITLLLLLGNVMTCYLYDNTSIWAHYPIITIIIGYTILRSFTASKFVLLTQLRNSLYLIILILRCASVVFGKTNAIQYVIPIIYIFMNTIFVSMLLLKSEYRVPMLSTGILNTVFNVIILGLVYFSVLTFTKLGILLTSISCVTSVILLINYIAYHIMSLSNKVM